MIVRKLIIALPLILAGASYAQQEDEETPIEFVTPEELAEALSAGTGLVVVDVRSERAYQRGHIPGAISIPLTLIQTSENLGLKKDDMIVLYCDCPKGGIAMKAARILRDRGFKNLWVMLRGTKFWPGELERTPEEEGF